MSDIVDLLKENTVTISEAMRQRAMAAQEIERCRQDEINAIEYRRVLADEIERLNEQTLALVREISTLRAERDKILRLWLEDADPSECGYTPLPALSTVTGSEP